MDHPGLNDDGDLVLVSIFDILNRGEIILHNEELELIITWDGSGRFRWYFMLDGEVRDKTRTGAWVEEMEPLIQLTSSREEAKEIAKNWMKEYGY